MSLWSAFELYTFVYGLFIVIVFASAVVKMFKSKDFYNLKKIVFLELCILGMGIITIQSFGMMGCAILIDLIKEIVLEYFGWVLIITFIFYQNLIIFFVIINILFIIIMKLKKYNKKNNPLSLKKHYIAVILFNIVISLVNVGVFFNAYNSNNDYYDNYVPKNAITYYENKYNISTKIIGKEYLEEYDDTIGPNEVEGIIYQLANDDKVYYDVETKKYYDNRQSLEIQNFVRNYYDKVLDDIINEFKEENSLSQYFGDNDEIEFYSDLMDVYKYDEYLYYYDDELYFDKYYDLSLDSSPEIISNIFQTSYMSTNRMTIKIKCDRNGNWDSIINKYFGDKKICWDFEFYDLNGTYFARYVNIDGEMVKK